MVGVVADGDPSVVEVGVRGRGWCCRRGAGGGLRSPIRVVGGGCRAARSSAAARTGRRTARRLRSRAVGVDRRRARAWRRPVRSRQQAGQVAGAGGPGLVHDQHTAPVEAAGFVPVDGDPQPGDRGRRDPGRDRQLVGGDTGMSGADHPIPGTFPGVAGGGEGECLAGTGRGGEHVDGVAGLGHLHHGADLLVGQPGSVTDRGGDGLVRAHRPLHGEQSSGRSRVRGVRSRAARTSSSVPGVAAPRSCDRPCPGSPPPVSGQVVQRCRLTPIDQRRRPAVRSAPPAPRPAARCTTPG